MHTRIHALRRVTLSIPGRMEASRREYDALVEAIVNRPAKEAREALLRHVTAAAEAAAVAIDMIQPRPGRERQELPVTPGR